MGTEGAVVFPEHCDHKEMANQTLIDGKALSAGFVSITVDPDTRALDVELYGRSSSLKMDANPAHAGLVARALGIDR